MGHWPGQHGSGCGSVNGPLARAAAAAGNPGPSSMLLVSQESEISALRIFLNSDFTGTLEQLAGKIQSSSPRGFLTLGTILGVPQCDSSFVQ